MKISIDITDSFGAIDFDNAGGIKTYINIPPTENLYQEFQFELSNFVLNLIDEPVLCSINRQDSIFLENMTDDGFLIISDATLTFKKIKGYEKLIRIANGEQDYLDLERHGQNLIDGDKIYDFSGRLASKPESIMNLAIISPKSITLEFNKKNHTYIEDYNTFRNSITDLNSKAYRTPPANNGLFDPLFSNMHTTIDLEGGYRIYKEKSKL